MASVLQMAVLRDSKHKSPPRRLHGPRARLPTLFCVNSCLPCPRSPKPSFNPCCKP